MHWAPGQAQASSLKLAAVPAGCTSRMVWLSCRGENKTSSDMQVYGASKLYNIMIAKALNEKLKGTGVEAFSAHPGILQSRPSWTPGLTGHALTHLLFED